MKRVAALEFDHFLKYYENSDDLNAKTELTGKEEILIARGIIATDERKGQSFNRSDNGYSQPVYQSWYQRRFL